MNLAELISESATLPGREGRPDEFQEVVIRHGDGPLWVTAGPGSGKTDSMVLRCIKLLVVDKVPPRSIVLTTFTEKAARNLSDRIALYLGHLARKFPDLKTIDFSRLRVGTLHGLCNDVMQEFRYSGYQNYRLLDEIEQRLFVLEHSSLAAISPPDSQLDIWNNMGYLVNRFDWVTHSAWKPGRRSPPTRWARARAAVTIFNRIVEDMVNVDSMAKAGGFWERVADAYLEYREKLSAFRRCDFAHLQVRFLDFLRTDQSRLFLEGDATELFPGVTSVLVDEYQDTNPVQEAIYLTLAGRPPHNLGVVGDDDQALYRFRGGTVDCMVNFPDAVTRAAYASTKIVNSPLPVNYRSHEKIVRFCDEFISHSPVMTLPGARASGKAPLVPRSQVVGLYPPILLIVRDTVEQLADVFAETSQKLVSQGTTACLGQTALLLRTTRGTDEGAAAFMNALSSRHLEFYNPRARAALQEESVQTALGAFLEVVDPESAIQSTVKGRGIIELATAWRQKYHQIASANPRLSHYVQTSSAVVRSMGNNQSVRVNIAEVFYHILGYEPFPGWMEDPNRTTLLGRVSKVFDAFANIPQSGRSNATLGDLYADSGAGSGINLAWRRTFYYSLLGVLAGEGLNEPEDSDQVVPLDRVPILTIHQAKGLQFPFVAVYGLSPPENLLKPQPAILLENDLRQFRSSPLQANGHTVEDRVNQDLTRLFYVAYSRAQCGLLLLATVDDLHRQGIGFGPGGASWLNRHATPV